ncbi:MAG: hypothetical protein V1809_16120 [Planctomycetota bacterium]
MNVALRNAGLPGGRFRMVVLVLCATVLLGNPAPSGNGQDANPRGPEIAPARGDLPALASHVLPLELDKEWIFEAGNSACNIVVKATPDRIAIELPAMNEGEYYLSYSRKVPVRPDALYRLQVVAEAGTGGGKDVIRLWDGENVQAIPLEKGVHDYEVYFRTGGKAAWIQVALLAGNQSGSRGPLQVVFRDAVFEEVEGDPARSMKFGRGWRFDPGKVDWSPVVQMTSDGVVIELPALAAGEYYNCYAKSVPVKPNALYRFQVNADASVGGGKDMIRLWDGENVQAIPFEKGVHDYEVYFRTGGKATWIQVALLAGNQSGGRGPLHVVFRDMVFEEVEGDPARLLKFGRGWRFEPGKVDWSPAVQTTSDGIAIELPAMKMGEYYNYYAKSVPVKPNVLYRFQVTADASVGGGKDMIRLWDGKNVKATEIKEGSRDYEIYFRTHRESDRLQVAVLAGNELGSRGPQRVAFKGIVLEEIPEAATSPDSFVLLPEKEYEVQNAASRRVCRQLLDCTMADIPSSPVVKRYKDMGEYPFSPDRVTAPGETDINRFRNEDQVVRRMPYPFYSALSIPSDCCASSLSDMFYTQSALSRELGLDWASSFWPHSDYPAANETPGLFCQDGTDFAHGPVEIEGEFVDRFPLQLIYYYRGWMDHIHTWSDGGMFAGSLVKEQKIEARTGGAVGKDLTGR